MRRDEVVRQLRELSGLRARLAAMEAALDTLGEDEREIIEKMLIRPVPGAVEKLCEMLCVEKSSVYRRRDKALRKLKNFLSDLRENSGTTLPFRQCRMVTESEARDNA